MVKRYSCIIKEQITRRRLKIMTHCVNVTVLLNGRVKPHSYLGLTSTTKLFHFRLIIRLGNYKCIKSNLQENIIPRNPIIESEHHSLSPFPFCSCVTKLWFPPSLLTPVPTAASAARPWTY